MLCTSNFYKTDEGRSPESVYKKYEYKHFLNVLYHCPIRIKNLNFLSSHGSIYFLILIKPGRPTSPPVDIKLTLTMHLKMSSAAFTC